MKVKRTITIDSEVDKNIERIIDRKMKGINAKTFKELKRLNKQVNYSSVVNDLLKRAIKMNDMGF